MNSKKLLNLFHIVSVCMLAGIVGSLYKIKNETSILTADHAKKDENDLNVRTDAKHGVIVTSDLTKFDNWPNVVSVTVPGNRTIYADYTDSDATQNTKSLIVFYGRGTRVTIDMGDQPNQPLKFTAEGTFPDVVDVAKDAALLLTSRSFIDRAVPNRELGQREILYLQSEDFAAKIQQQIKPLFAEAKTANHSESFPSAEGEIFTLHDGKPVAAVLISWATQPCFWGIFVKYSNNSGFSVMDRSMDSVEGDELSKRETELKISAYGLFPAWDVIVGQAREILSDTKFVESNGILDGDVAVKAKDFASRLSNRTICPRAAQHG